jgi:hypothetical protein
MSSFTRSCSLRNIAMAASESQTREIAGDAEWLAHRHDAANDSIQFVRATRADHRAAVFLIDAELAGSAQPTVIDRKTAIASISVQAPIHFIFHSAYCCSTLLARAFDIEGVSMGLKEPLILNDLIGWKHRGGEPQRIAQVMDSALTLLARPFGPGEAIVVKPSNVVTSLIPAMLTIRPESRALLLHAPLQVYLSSIARKGMWGRLWVRELFVKLSRDGLINYGFTPEETIQQTDLQIAAIGWLAQHRFFAAVAKRHPDRVRTLDSETLLARPKEVMAKLGLLFGLKLDSPTLDEVVEGEAFNRHSKDGSAFDREARKAEQRDGAEVHSDEVEKVMLWAQAVAESAGQSLSLPESLLD